MLMILFYHCACYQQILSGYMNPNIHTIISLFVTYGLTAFTFSSGFKLAFNHYKDINNDTFFMEYLPKRSWHLYKIYLVYPFICLIIYGFLIISNLIKYVQPYVAGIGSIKLQSLFDWFLGSVPPVFHLWFIFILFLINIIALLLLRFTKLRGVLIVFLFLLLYFLVYPHILTNICITEIPYYVLLYLIIYLSGLIMGSLYNINKRYFEITLTIVSIFFLLIITLFYIFDIKQLPFPNNKVLILLYGNVFFRWGLTYPCFIMSVLYLMRRCRFLSPLCYLKKDTLYIYLLQYPFVIPFYTRLLINLNVKHTTIITLDSFLLSLVTCVLIHRLTNYIIKHLKSKKTNNKDESGNLELS